MVRWLAVLFCVCVALPGLIWLSPVRAQEAPPTPTPNAEGNIYVIVQPNDSMWSIAARAGITLQTLLDLNGLTESSIVRPGDRLLIGQVGPLPTATPEPTLLPTRRPPTPTPTLPPPPLTAVCLVAFMDENRDGVYDSGEPLQGAVAFTIFTEQAVVANYITDGLAEPHCLPLEPGTYRITRSLGQDEVLTNDGDMAVLLRRGDVLELAFGSYRGGVVEQAQAVETAVPAVPTLPVAPTTPPSADPAPTRAAEPAVAESPPNLLVWGVVALTAVLIGGGILFAIRPRPH